MTLNINESASAQRQQAQRRSSNYPSFYYVANMPSNRYVRQPQQDTYIPSEKKIIR